MQKPAFFANFTRAICVFHLRLKESIRAEFIFGLKTRQKEWPSRKPQIDKGEFSDPRKDYKKV